MSAGFLSQIKLKRHASVQTLAGLLVPEGKAQQYQAAHHLLWTLFSDDPERKRDFLWRQIAPGEFITLSERKPVDPHDLFDIKDPKPFEPELKKGDQLQFLLRVNATMDRKDPKDAGRKVKKGRPVSKRYDVVMDALKRLEPKDRLKNRQAVTQTALENWFKKRGEQSGFEPVPFTVTIEKEEGVLIQEQRLVAVQEYDVLDLPRNGRDKMSFGVADLTGKIQVTEPDLLISRLMQGMGRAKAFGCGLMLIRRPV